MTVMRSPWIISLIDDMTTHVGYREEFAVSNLQARFYKYIYQLNKFVALYIVALKSILTDNHVCTTYVDPIQTKSIRFYMEVYCSGFFISIKIPMQRKKFINKSTSLCPSFTLFLSKADTHTHTQLRFLSRILTWFNFSKKKWLFRIFNVNNKTHTYDTRLSNTYM